MPCRTSLGDFFPKVTYSLFDYNLMPPVFLLENSTLYHPLLSLHIYFQRKPHAVPLHKVQVPMPSANLPIPKETKLSATAVSTQHQHTSTHTRRPSPPANDPIPRRTECPSNYLLTALTLPSAHTPSPPPTAEHPSTHLDARTRRLPSYLPTLYRSTSTSASTSAVPSPGQDRTG